MKIGILAEFPLPVVLGGLEFQCLKTFDALKEIGAPVELLEYHNRESVYDIIHIFGNPPSMYEVCYFASQTKKIIISAVCGMQNASGIKAAIKTAAYKTLAKCAGFINETTDYKRLQFMFRTARKVIALNEFEKSFIVSRYCIDPEKVVIIPNGVEKSFFIASPNEFVNHYHFSDFILFTGNIVQRKNPLLLAQALLEMGEKGVFIGSIFPSEQEYAEKFARVIKKSPNLLWIQGLSYQDSLLASSYSAARVFCLPSSSETQPLSALEAMATGRPVILGDKPYSYEKPFEVVVRCEFTVESIINSIKIASEVKVPFTLGLDFTWENVARRLFSLYEDLSKEKI